MRYRIHRHYFELGCGYCCENIRACSSDCCLCSLRDPAKSRQNVFGSFAVEISNANKRRSLLWCEKNIGVRPARNPCGAIMEGYSEGLSYVCGHEKRPTTTSEACCTNGKPTCSSPGLRPDFRSWHLYLANHTQTPVLCGVSLSSCHFGKFVRESIVASTC